MLNNLLTVVLVKRLQLQLLPDGAEVLRCGDEHVPDLPNVRGAALLVQVEPRRGAGRVRAAAD